MKILKLSQNLQFVKTPEGLDERETIRAIRDAIVNEQLAVQQYETIVDGTSNSEVKKVLQDIANEEKTHIGELSTLLKELDPEEVESLEKGEKEVKGEK
jgi:rubrerythrin